jgi:molybdopterin-binding protein
MAKTKLLTGVLLVLAVLFAQVGSAAAAPLTQDGTITLNGVVTNVGDPFTAENGDTMIPVTIETADGLVTVNLSEATVTDLGLVKGSEVKDLPVNSGDVVPPDETTDEVHPIAQVLAEYFEVEPSVVEGYHDDGFGFGVIAQAMWMSQEVGGDASLAGDILQAKLSGDYSAFIDPETGQEVTNWGQFKKLMLHKDNKHNLGVIVSGHAPTGDQNTEEKGKGKHKPPKKDKPHGNPHNQ